MAARCQGSAFAKASAVAGAAMADKTADKSGFRVQAERREKV